MLNLEELERKLHSVGTNLVLMNGGTKHWTVYIVRIAGTRSTARYGGKTILEALNNAWDGERTTQSIPQPNIGGINGTP